MRRVAILLLLVLTSCSFDTELGLAATINRATVTVAADDSVSVSIDITYRVGEHAEGALTFQPQAIELYVADTLVASLVPSAPPGFVRTVRPGESYDATLNAVSDGVTDPRRLCGAEVLVLFRWVDGSVMAIGMTDSSTSDVACS